MKIEKLEVSNKKVKVAFILGIILTATIFILINYLTSRASYRNTQSIPLMSGTITYKMPDISIMAINVQQEENGAYKESETIPIGNYKINETESYCLVGASKDHIKNIVYNYNNNIGTIGIDGIKQKNTKCNLTFDFHKQTPAEQMIAKLEASKGSKYTIVKLKAPFEKSGASSTSKLYSYPENGGTTYVFRGNVQDNWVTFAGKTWRIIRINSDRTLRVIFQCDTDSCTDTTGSGRYVKSTKYASPIDANANTYLGYYYGTESSSDYNTTHSNATKGMVATVVTDWYNSNLTSYTSKISGSTGFCNDRRLSSGTNGKGTGTSYTTYRPDIRFYNKTSVTPDLSCEKNDLYTLKGDAGNGNGVLEVPAALITADEAALAGITDDTNKQNWLYISSDYWTMSPSSCSGSCVMIM